MRTSLFVLIVIILLSSACRSEPALADVPSTSMVASVETQQPINTLPPPQVLSSPTVTSTSLPTFTPTGTPSPTDTPTPPATPTPTSTPVVLTSAEDFGSERSPFTGEIVDEPANLQRRPIAIKISNWKAEWVRPQSGLSQADLVFEHIAEGVTRFTALFHSQTPPALGSIRSARLIDLELPIMYDAALAYSGAHDFTRRILERSSFRSRLLHSYLESFYRTEEDKPWEHTLFADPELLWAYLDIFEENVAPTLGNTMPFDERVPEGGEPVSAIDVAYFLTDVRWEYDSEGGRYWRVADGEPHMDANNGLQLSSANVVVLWVIHEYNQDVCVKEKEGKCIERPMEIKIWGQGQALLFRDGQMYRARWQRQQDNQMLTLIDSEDNLIPFQIGNTWFQVLPTYFDDHVTVEP